jgi:hypothetical protein
MKKNDTTRLLLLTGVLGSISLCAIITGCSIVAADEEPESAPAAVSFGDAAAPSKSDEAPPASSSNTSGGTSGTSGGTSGTSGGTSGTTPPKTDAGTTDSGKDSGTTKDGGTVACLDDSAPAVQPACPTAGAGDECVGACADFATSWKKGLSADIRKCLTATICQNGTTATCADKALAKACPDPTATTFCTPNVTGCKNANAADTITQASCEGIAKGLNAAGRASLLTCFQQEFNCGDCPAKFK